MLKAKVGDFLVVISLMLILFALFSIDTTVKADNLKVALVLQNIDNPFYENIKKGAEEKAVKSGIELTTIDAKNDGKKQIKSVKKLFLRQIDVVILDPVNVETAKRINKLAGIMKVPLITFELDEKEKAGDICITYDDFQAGEKAGEYLVEKIHKSNSIIEVKGSNRGEVSQKRSNGFNKKINKYVDLNILRKATAGFDYDKGKRVINNVLMGHGNIDAVFAHNSEMALGAIKALEERGKLEDTLVVGIGICKGTIEAIENGKLNATVSPDPFLMGEKAIEYAKRMTNGEKIENNIVLPLELITKYKLAE